VVFFLAAGRRLAFGKFSLFPKEEYVGRIVEGIWLKMSEVIAKAIDEYVGRIHAVGWIAVVWGRQIWSTYHPQDPHDWNQWIVYKVRDGGVVLPKIHPEWWHGVWHDPR